MQPKRFFWNYFISLVIIVLLCSTLLGALLYREISNRTFFNLKNDLKKETEVLALLLETNPDLVNNPVTLARSVHNGDRLTLISGSGEVIIDNWAEAAGRTDLENHSDRPEFQAALRGTPAFVQRFSETVGSTMLYYALPVKLGQETPMVLRLSFALSSFEEQRSTVRNFIIAGAALAALLSLPFAYLISRGNTRQIERLRTGTNRLASGDLGYRIPPEGSLEFHELASDFNKMADELNLKILSIKQEHSRIDTLLARMVEGVLALDQHGKAIFANPAFCSMFDLKMERLQGKTFLEISRNAQLSDFISSLLTGQHEQEQHGGSREITLYVPQGEKIFSVQASKISQETDGEMVLLVFHDITRIKKVEQIRRDFVANVSHELRTPLTALTGSTELLLDGAYRNEEECKKFLEIMDKQLRNIQNLVSDMLKLAAVEDSRIPFTREAVNLRELTEDISKIIEPIARKKNQTLRVVVPPEEVLLHVDQRQFSDALTNLLDNAVKYTDEGGRIELTCRINGGIEVEVRDNGPGIPRDQLSRIFERFYRLDKSRSREMGGTGLGLSITKHIVENHGGSISVESEPGQGTIFTIRLPQSSFVLQHS